MAPIALISLAAIFGRDNAFRRPKSLYSLKHVTFEEDAGAYNQRDAEGFIKPNALRLRLAKMGRGLTQLLPSC